MKINIDGTKGELFEFYTVIAILAIGFFAMWLSLWLSFVANFNIEIITIGAILGLGTYGLIKIGKKIIDRKQ